MKKPVNEPQQVQGEGDYKAARRYRASVQTFVKSGKVDKAAHDAAPETTQEQEALRKAERVGESRSKGEGPSPKRSPARKP
jgi:hypothetical protein